MRLLPFFLFLFLFAACDSAEVPIPEPVPVDSVVAGVNLNALLATPTGPERSRVQETLGQRAETIVPLDPQRTTGFGDGNASVEVISFTTPFQGSVGRAYGAIRIPSAPPGTQPDLPVLLVIPDGEGDVSTTDFLTTGPHTELGEVFAQVLLAPPGHTLRANGTTYASEQLPVPEVSPVLYDFEVDFARAMLKAALTRHEDTVDPQRIGYVGFGRGGSVALLTASRPAGSTYTFAPQTVAAIAPFTDFTAPSFRNVVRLLLQDRQPDFPGSDALAERFLHPLREGNLSMGEVREALLRRSPIFFAGGLPALYLRHGADDFVIGSDHSARLADVTGGTNIEIIPEAGHTSVLFDENVQRNLATYLLNRLGE